MPRSRTHRDAVAAFTCSAGFRRPRKQPDAAIAAYQEVVRLNPLATDAKIALARLQLASGDPDPRSLRRRGVEGAAPEPDARLVLVQGLIMRGDLTAATGRART